MTKMLTEPQARALKILIDAKGSLSARGFAQRMWPDSSGWRTLSDVRKGVVRGKAMPGLAGRFLWRLYKMGLVAPRPIGYSLDWHITTTGRRVYFDQWRQDDG